MLKIYIGYTRDEIRSELNKQKKQWQTLDFVEPGLIQELASSTNFLSGPKIFLISDFPDTKESISILEDTVFQNSENEFHFQSLVPKSYFSKKLLGFTETKTLEKIKVKDGQAFALSNAMFSGGAQDIWLAFNKLTKSTSDEELHGIFLWALKSIVIYKRFGQNGPIDNFTASKIKDGGSFAKKDIEYIKDVYEKALTIYVRAHLGEIDFNKSMESLILTLPR